MLRGSGAGSDIGGVGGAVLGSLTVDGSGLHSRRDALAVDAGKLDVLRFERLVVRARELLDLGEADRAGPRAYVRLIQRG